MRPFALSRVPFGLEDWFSWDVMASDQVFDLGVFKNSLAERPIIEAWTETPAFGRAGLQQSIHSTPTQPEAPSPALCGCASCMKVSKYWDALLGGDKDAPPPPTQPLAITVDAQPGDTSTTATLTVDGPHVVSTLELPGDFDFFRVELNQGELYDIGQYLVAGAPSGVPLADAYLELYDAQGNLIISADGGGPNTPQGLDALLTYEAQYTGMYFINARSFDNGAPDGAAGDYEVFVDRVDPNDQNAYRPLYTPDQPMHSIDWGAQVDRTSRNPDGDNGARDNGAPDTGVVYNPQFDIYGKNVITYYYAKTGDVFIDEDQTSVGLTTTMVAKGMEQWEKDAFRVALDEYEKVTDNIYIEVDNRAEADFKFITYNGTPGAGGSVLGRMSAPNTDNEGQMEINAGDVRWTQEGVSQGGFYFPTLLHELGHGHGMAHPHDNGGRSSVMPGADGGTGGLGGGYGDWGLSQQVFTIMSYNDGWNEGAPHGARPLGHGGPRSGGITGAEVDHYGWVGTLSALDIAVLQDKYGVNEQWATGDDVYTIADENGAGKFYSCIWDAAGTDEIRYDGVRNAYIDLRAATLEYEEGGGGWVSYALGAWTGVTIANGVTIENATSGAGADELGGNDAANVLNSGAGADTIEARAGDDILIGGAGGDTLDGGDGLDTASYEDSAGAVTVSLTGAASGASAAGDRLISIENLTGSAFKDTLAGNGSQNLIDGGAGADVMSGRGGADTLNGGAGIDTLLGGAGADTFVFQAGQANGDKVSDFDGLLQGDHILLEGYGTAEEGATFTQLDLTRWQVTSADGSIVDVITFTNGASIDSGDYLFG